MSKVAVLIAVETYLSKRIPSVRFAEADAIGLSNALAQHDVDPGQQTILINVTATKTSVESRLRMLLRRLQADDILYFYYAGHGFSKNGENYITCYDTELSDLEHTSIKVQWIFDLFRASSCSKIVMFLDSCESGMTANERIRGIYSYLDEDELTEFFKGAKHCICFAACKPGEESHSARKLKHGIWTYHLIEALNGEAPVALEKRTFLTSNSLQNYLCQQVPRTLRNLLTGTEVQTPWLFGAMSQEFLVADVAHILAAKRNKIDPTLKQLISTRLFNEDSFSVKSLSGFKKGHRVPDRVCSATESFVTKIAQADIDEEIDKVFDALRREFQFKRKDIEYNSGDGGGSIITPMFDFEIDVRIDPDDPSDVIWTRQVVNIREPQAVLSDAFESVFTGKFDTLEFSSGKRIDLGAIVDQIENMESDDISVAYDKELTWCEIDIRGIGATIRVTPEAFSVVQKTLKSPRQLIEAFFKTEKLLTNDHQIKQLPFVP